MCVSHIFLSTHLLMDTIGCFQVLAVVNCASMNIEVHQSFQIIYMYMCVCVCVYTQLICRIICILSPCLFNLYVEYIMRNAGLEEAQARIKIAGRNINNLRYADATTLMAESKEELKSP